MSKNISNLNPKIMKAAKAAKSTDELAVLSDEALSGVAGGAVPRAFSGIDPMQLPFVRSEDAGACPAFQWIPITDNGILYIKYCDNCLLHMTAEQEYPELAAQAAEAGLLLCGKVG